MEAVAVVDVKTKRYWVGTLESCPIEQLTLAGVSFPRRTVIRKKLRDLDQIVGQLDGAMVELTDERADKVRAEIERSVVRWHGKPSEFCKYGVKGDVLDTTAKVEVLDAKGDHGKWRHLYQRRPEDQPLGPHVCFRVIETEADAPQFFNRTMTPYARPSGPAVPAKTPRRIMDNS